MAGHPAGTWDALSNHAAMVSVALWSWAPAAQVFAWTLAMVFLLPLLAGYASARALGWSPKWRLAAMGVFALAFWAMASEPGAFLRYGMYGFAGMLALVPLFLAMTGASTASPAGWRSLPGLLPVAALGTLLHPFFLGLAGFALALGAVDAIGRRRLGRWLAVLGTTGAGAALALGPWIPGLLHASGSLRPAAPFFQGTLAALGQRLASPELLLWAVGGVGLVLWWRRPEERRHAFLFGATAALLLVLGGFGARLPGAAALEPARFLGGLSLVLTLPAVDAARRALSAETPLLRWTPAALVAASLVPGAIAVSQVASGAERLLAWTGEPSGDGRLPPDLVQLVDALPALVSPGARLMAEDSDHDREGHMWGDGHLLALLPRKIGREVIGGPMEESRMAHHFVDFNHARFLDRTLSEYEDDELRERLSFLNVGTVVAWSDEAIADLEKRPFLDEEASFGRYRVFGVRRLPAWISGHPAVTMEASVDRIAVRDAPPGPIVLPYHWDPGWVADPPLSLFRAERLGDPVGFVGVRNGESTDFVLRFDPDGPDR
jgi:hypothetical protein